MRVLEAGESHKTFRAISDGRIRGTDFGNRVRLILKSPKLRKVTHDFTNQMVSVLYLEMKGVELRIAIPRGKELSNGMMRELNHVLLIKNDEIFAPGGNQMDVVRNPLRYRAAHR